MEHKLNKPPLPLLHWEASNNKANKREAKLD